MRTRLVLPIIALVIFGAVRGWGQTPRLQFEVSSVKPSTSGFNGVRGGCHGINSRYGLDQVIPPLGRCVITDGRLSNLITTAYALRSTAMIKGAPDWVIGGAERFTVEAKAEDPTKTTEEQLQNMLQALLADRFKLKFHYELLIVPGFALAIGKNGPKLQEAKGDDIGKSLGPRPPAPGEPFALTIRGFSMPIFAELLSNLSPDPIVDQTGLTGSYDFKLSWDEVAGPSLATALREQLGLRLEPHRVPVSFFVFESAQRPSGN